MKTRLPPGIFEIGSGIPPSHKYGVENGVNVPDSELPEICPENESAPRQVSWSPNARTTMVIWKVSATLVPDALPVTVPVKVPTRPPKSRVFGARVPVTADQGHERRAALIPGPGQSGIRWRRRCRRRGWRGRGRCRGCGRRRRGAGRGRAGRAGRRGGGPPPPLHAAMEMVQIRTEAIRMRCILEVWTDGR